MFHPSIPRIPRSFLCVAHPRLAPAVQVFGLGGANKKSLNARAEGAGSAFFFVLLPIASKRHSPAGSPRHKGLTVKEMKRRWSGVARTRERKKVFL